MYNFHTFLFIYVYKKRHFIFINHNHLKNHQEPQESSVGTLLFSSDQSQPSSMAGAPVLTSTPRKWTYEELITTVLTCNEQTIYWLQSKHLLASSMDCSKCSSQCRLVKRKGTLYWRCPRKGCQAVISVRDKSFFANSKLSLQTILKLMYQWTRQTRVTSTASEVKVSESVAIDWYNFFRDVCSQYFLDHHITIEGPGKTVEIDESKLGKRKYHQGRHVEFLWRRRFGDFDLLEKMLEHIAEQYPL